VCGAYPLKAVGFELAEAFGVAVDEFDAHPNNGKSPTGLACCIKGGADLETIKPTLKIVQAVQQPGDSISITMDGMRLVVTLDAIMLKSKPGYRQYPMASLCWRQQQVDPCSLESLEPQFPQRPKAHGLPVLFSAGGSRGDNRYNREAHCAPTGGGHENQEGCQARLAARLKHGLPWTLLCNTHASTVRDSQLLPS
jgi:hypothetical protein